MPAFLINVQYKKRKKAMIYSDFLNKSSLYYSNGGNIFNIYAGVFAVEKLFRKFVRQRKTGCIFKEYPHKPSRAARREAAAPSYIFS